MKITQVYELTNAIAQELLGESVIVQEDLSNVVELGKQFESVAGLDNYVRALHDHIGKMIFVDRVYRGRAPSVLMDGWEYGSIVEKVSAELPDAEENESWELQNGASYDPNIFYKPKVSVSLWNNRVTFEIPISITERQVKSAFSNATQLNAFISMIYTSVENAMTLRISSLIMRTINNYIAESVFVEYQGEALNTKSGVRAINLLQLYRVASNQPDLTFASAMADKEFLRFAAYQIKQTAAYMEEFSTVWNIGGKERFTPRDRMHIVMLDAFASATDVYLYGGENEFRANEFDRLPDAERVAYWQGSGQSYDLADVSKINVKTASGNDVEVTGILATIFDREALGVSNIDRRVTSNWNGKAEFWNYFHKFEAGFFNDINENFVVFFAA